MTVRPLIDQWLPAPAIGAESLRDASAAKKPPPNRLHVWWARRPLTASRAAVVASLLPAWPADEEAASDSSAARVLRGLRREFPEGELEYHQWFLRILGILGDPVTAKARIKEAVANGTRTIGNAYGYERAFTVSPDAGTIGRLMRLASLRADIEVQPNLLDPFAGGGAIPFEAARFGCRTIANELNPVAAAILHGTVDLPSKLGPAFAATIEHWGTRWAKRVEAKLAPYYPHQDPRERLAYIWAHTVPCPSTGRPTPLAPDFWLAHGKAGKEIAVRLTPDPESGRIEIALVEGRDAATYGNDGTYKDGAATSIWTDETFGGEYIRERACAHEMGEMLLAISVTIPGKRGRTFRVPTAADLVALSAADTELARRLPQWEIDGLVPSEPIPYGTDTRPQQHGLYLWRDLFTSRQLLAALTSLEELHSLIAEARGALGDEDARALALYLAFALDKTVDYNGMLSSWHATRTTIRNVFDRHDFSFKWSFAELDGASAALPWAVAQVADAYRGMAKLVTRPDTLLERGGRVEKHVLLGSAVDLSLPSNSVDVIVTDPPYYNNVMYAECSDYFYVWLKRSLSNTWPDLCTQVLTDKEAEVVANPSLFRDVTAPSPSRRRTKGPTADQLADERYESLLTRCFKEAHRVLKDDGVMTVMFTHERVDAWDTLGQALLQSGFSINSSWPVRTESEQSLHQAKKNAANSTILLTCRKRGDTAPAYWADIRDEVATVARMSVSRFADDGLVGIDLTLSTFGPVLAVLSRNWPVYTGDLDAAGQPQVLRPDIALDLAREEVARLKKRGLLGGRDVEFDRVTDWYLLAWTDFKAAEFPSGEALKLSIATHLELHDLARQHRLVRATSGTVTLLTPAQRRTAKALDPGAAVWPTMIDSLHALMLVHDEEGLGAARAWLERTGRAGDQRFADLLWAALRAIPRTKEKGEFVRPEARMLESLRATLFESIPAPPDEQEQPEQLALVALGEEE